ncbi:GNAT family N-acetyltransferase [Spiractinospora alimapuensis]|uniref:GNAT family N-acetyltransferase n=1 Tax=Spiractinospora alimapuensis TaxID=2820884 RepID=UPI001F456F5F|nr:GNAT family N-acetyltransferase [Spiractinospora alimapuensis]QVQ53013.1 GNAT family N-acetyltransferase [Spiractinospora alimapuensis]
MLVRPASPEEFPTIGDLRVTAYVQRGFLREDDSYAAELRRLGMGADTRDEVLVAVEEDRLVGTVTLMWRGDQSELVTSDEEAEIRALAVAPDAQGRGVARALVGATVTRARRSGAHTLLLCTQPTMRRAQRLYDALGFHRRPSLDWTPDGVDFTLLAYSLSLASSPHADARTGAEA